MFSHVDDHSASTHLIQTLQLPIGPIFQLHSCSLTLRKHISQSSQKQLNQLSSHT